MNGMEYTFYIPFIVRRAWPLSPHGVMMQRQLDANEMEEAKISGEPALPTIFAFTNPFAEPAPIGLTERISGGFYNIPATLKDDGLQKAMVTIPAEEQVVFVSQPTTDVGDPITVTVDAVQKKLTIWRYALIKPKDIPSRPLSPRTTRGNRRSSVNLAPNMRTTVGSGERVPLAGEMPPLNAIHIPPPMRADKTPMDVVIDAAAANVPWVSAGGRGHQRHESLAQGLDRMALGGVDKGIEKVDASKMQAAFWMERLFIVDIPYEE